MKQANSNEFLVELFSLIIIVTVVQAIWVTVIRPACGRDQRLQPRRDGPRQGVRSRARYVHDHQGLRAGDLRNSLVLGVLHHRLQVARHIAGAPPAETRICSHFRPGCGSCRRTAASTRGRSRRCPPRCSPSYCRARCCRDCIASGRRENIQDVAFAIRETCNLETDRLDSELSMVRFVAWAIPAIGFVGTVRGIGNSLQQAHKAVEGDVSGVVAGLGHLVQFHAGGVVAQHRGDAVSAPDAVAPGAHGAGYRELSRLAPDPSLADALAAHAGTGTQRRAAEPGLAGGRRGGAHRCLGTRASPALPMRSC